MRRADFSAAVVRAFDGAGDIIRPARLERVTPDAYDPAAGGPASVAVAVATGRALFGRVASSVDGLVLETGEVAVWLHGFAFPPQPGDRLSIDGTIRTIRRVEDLAGAGLLHLVAAR